MNEVHAGSGYDKSPLWQQIGSKRWGCRHPVTGAAAGGRSDDSRRAVVGTSGQNSVGDEFAPVYAALLALAAWNGSQRAGIGDVEIGLLGGKQIHQHKAGGGRGSGFLGSLAFGMAFD